MQRGLLGPMLVKSVLHICMDPCHRIRSRKGAMIWQPPLPGANLPLPSLHHCRILPAPPTSHLAYPTGLSLRASPEQSARLQEAPLTSLQLMVGPNKALSCFGLFYFCACVIIVTVEKEGEKQISILSIAVAFLAEMAPQDTPPSVPPSLLP